MKRRFVFVPWLLLALQSLMPAGRIVAAICGWNLTPANGFAYAVFLAAVSLSCVLLLIKRDIAAAGRVCLSIVMPLGFLNLLMMPKILHIPTFIAALLNAGICSAAFVFGRGRALRVVMGVITGLLAAVTALVAFFVFMMGDFGVTEVVRSVPSPDGKYVVQVIDSDQGALGGNTVVRLKRTKLLGLPVDKIVTIDKKLWIGDWGVAYETMVLWDGDTLKVNYMEFEVR